MDIKTHETITAAVQHIEGVKVLPIPESEDDVAFLTITTPEGIQASSILNTLSDNGLLGRTAMEQRTMIYNPRPELGIIGLTSAGITFVHRNRNNEV